jgi:hypothetical protein
MKRNRQGAVGSKNRRMSPQGEIRRVRENFFE